MKGIEAIKIAEGNPTFRAEIKRMRRMLENRDYLREVINHEHPEINRYVEFVIDGEHFCYFGSTWVTGFYRECYGLVPDEMLGQPEIFESWFRCYKRDTKRAGYLLPFAEKQGETITIK